MIKKLITARHMVDTTLDDGKIALTAKSSKQTYKKKRLVLVGCYLLSIIIVELNNLLVFLIRYFIWINKSLYGGFDRFTLYDSPNK